MREGRVQRVPLIGVGGVRTGRDALELIAAGATGVQVGTATFNDPTAPQRVLAELAQLAESHGVDRITDLVGVAHDRMVLP
jgi:dihydroorotate dehydrogenase (NAD+) catalytic subunit